VNLGGLTAMAKGREIPFWRTFVGTFGFFFSSKCLGRIGFWQTLLFFGYSSCRGRRDFGIFSGFERQYSQFCLDTSGMPNFVAVGHFNT
jgi:hypothetical protein